MNFATQSVLFNVILHFFSQKYRVAKRAPVQILKQILYFLY